jgi:hypothetical protein
MKISRTTAWTLLALLLVVLFIGTQMPGTWRDGAMQTMHMPWYFTKVAHFVTFVCIAFPALVGNVFTSP